MFIVPFFTGLNMFIYIYAYVDIKYVHINIYIYMYIYIHVIYIYMFTKHDFSTYTLSDSSFSQRPLSELVTPRWDKCEAAHFGGALFLNWCCSHLWSCTSHLEYGMLGLQLRQNGRRQFYFTGKYYSQVLHVWNIYLHKWVNLGVNVLYCRSILQQHGASGIERDMSYLLGKTGETLESPWLPWNFPLHQCLDYISHDVGLKGHQFDALCSAPNLTA